MITAPTRPLIIETGGTQPEAVACLFQRVQDMLGLGEDGPVTGPRPILLPVGPGEALSGIATQLKSSIAGVDASAGMPSVLPVGAEIPAATDILLRTSGSTSGRGSLVAMSAQALEASAHATFARLEGPGQWILALPAQHVAGIQVLVRSALAGRAPITVDTSGGFQPRALAEAIEAWQGAADVPLYISLVPTQLQRCLDDEDATVALRAASAILVGGAATSVSLYERARQAGLRVVRTYGMSETGGGCVYDGRPLDGVSIRIEGGCGVEEHGEAGRIVIAGPMLAEAVLGGSARLREGDSGRELLTNDLGIFDGHVLNVLGRADDVIISGGIKVQPREVEEALSALPGVAQCCVVGVPDERWGSAVVAAVVCQPGAEVTEAVLLAQARQQLDGAHTPKRVIFCESLPVRGPGKIDRRAVAALARLRQAQG